LGDDQTDGKDAAKTVMGDSTVYLKALATELGEAVVIDL
jgi:hypothetical protein